MARRRHPAHHIAEIDLKLGYPLFDDIFGRDRWCKHQAAFARSVVRRLADDIRQVYPRTAVRVSLSDVSGTAVQLARCCHQTTGRRIDTATSDVMALASDALDGALDRWNEENAA